MKYIVLEIQSGETTSTIVNQYDSREAAEGSFHQILAFAAVSSVPVHSAILMTDECFPLRNECYKHLPDYSLIEE